MTKRNYIIGITNYCFPAENLGTVCAAWFFTKKELVHKSHLFKNRSTPVVLYIFFFFKGSPPPKVIQEAHLHAHRKKQNGRQKNCVCI